MPHLYIIAGPNGSGKSLFSKDLVTVDYTVFDGDKYVTALKEQFPETGSDVLEKFVNDKSFKEAKERAIAENKSFAFESNFSAADPMISQREFEKAGYETHLYFIGLDTLEQSSKRVEIRVK